MNNEMTSKISQHAVAVDGRTDEEKLVELLSSRTECSELDFKETLDLSNKADELHFVKDAVAMFNRYPGGYLVIGATDNGDPSPLSEGTDWKQFDGARIADKILKYTSARLTPTSTIHVIDGHTYCLICFQSPSDGLPISFNKLGQYEKDNHKVEVVFREGDIVIRCGAQNQPLGSVGWTDVLRRHDEIVREEESSRINLLIDRISYALSEKGKTPPLIIDGDDSVLASSLEQAMVASESMKIRKFISEVEDSVFNNPEALRYLVMIAATALSVGDEESYSKSVDTLYDYYYDASKTSKGFDKRLFEVLVSVYEIGAVVVFRKRWDLLSELVNKQSPASYGYEPYASWVRDCQVNYNRSTMFHEKGSSTLISLIVEAMRSNPASVSSILGYPSSDETESRGDRSSYDDKAINLLCAFDFLYCICVFTEGKGMGSAYPACVYFKEERIIRIEEKLYGRDEKMRRALLPRSSDERLADATRQLYALMANETMGRINCYWGSDPSGAIRVFLDKNAPSNSSARG